jgi:hypothetical protein
MSHGQPHEEAEHAAHHASDPFDRRVAMSMVVIAALLAAVKVQGHRTHNDTLSDQIQAGVAQSKSGAEHTLESDQWNFFQAKKQRQYLYETQAAMMQASFNPPSGAVVPEVTATGVPGGERYVKDMMKDKISEADAKKIVARMDKVYLGLLKKGFPEEKAKQVVDWLIKAAGYQLETAAIRKDAEAHHEQGKKHAEESAEHREKSTHKHHQADYFDLGELGVELALVLASVAILTKRPGYWYAGLAVCAVGLVSVAAGFFQH